MLKASEAIRLSASMASTPSNCTAAPFSPAPGTIFASSSRNSSYLQKIFKKFVKSLFRQKINPKILFFQFVEKKPTTRKNPISISGNRVCIFRKNQFMLHHLKIRHIYKEKERRRKFFAIHLSTIIYYSLVCTCTVYIPS